MTVFEPILVAHGLGGRGQVVKRRTARAGKPNGPSLAAACDNSHAH
jgi:hypothetical protein